MSRALTRRLPLTVALICGVTQPSLAQDAQGSDTVAVVRGTIEGSFQGELRPLGFAVVQAVTSTVRRSAQADSEGRYELRRLPPGEAQLTVTRAGYEALTLTVLIPRAGSVTVDLQLAGDPVILPPVEVLSDGPSSSDARVGSERDPPIPEIELRALDLGPGIGQSGLVDVIGSLPGNDPADATDVLYMRGSTTDLRLVLLDGVPVYTPFHVAGLLRSFEPAVLGAADLHVGGAPARFDGGLTHILELRTRKARRDRFRFSGALDLLAASAAVETPVGEGGGIIASARSLHDLGTIPLRGDRPYGYRDALLSAHADLAPRHELRATGFWNAESVLLDPNRAPDARWSNRAGSLTYRGDTGAARLELTAGLSAYRASLPLQPSQLPGEPPPLPIFASAASDRARVVGEATWGPPAAPLRTGISIEHIRADFDARSSANGSSAESRGSTSALGVFVDATRPLVTGVTARAGLRVDHFTGYLTRLAPRAALTFELGPQALLTVAAGRYHQPTRTPDVEVERTLAEVTADGELPGELLPVATADHVVVSLEQHLGGTVRLGLDGFWKGFDNLPTALDETVRSSGIDLRVAAAGERGAAWLGYGLSWFWSTVDLSGHASEFSGRHLLTAGISGGLSGPLRGEARVAYGAGLPYTSIPFRSGAADATSNEDAVSLSGSRNTIEEAPLLAGLDEAFLRLDIEVYAVLEPHWAGLDWRLRPYVRLLNALDRRDALFYTFQPWRSDTVTPLAERPLLPVLGVAVSF